MCVHFVQCESSSKKRKTNDAGDVLNRKLSEFYPRMLMSGVRGVGGKRREGSLYGWAFGGRETSRYMM